MQIIFLKVLHEGNNSPPPLTYGTFDLAYLAILRYKAEGSIRI